MLYLTAQHGSLLSLDTHGLDSKTLHFEIATSIGGKADIYIENFAQFSIENLPLIASLDEEIRRNFSADLEANEGDCPLIAHAALAGAYAHLLFSSGKAKEAVHTFRDGEAVDNEHHGHNLDVHCKIIIAHRLGELVEEVMVALRPGDPGNGCLNNLPNDFAAGVILHHELEHFKSSLRNGFLCRQGLPSLPAELLHWIGSVEHELIERIREACGRFLNWGAAIKGSMKKLRRKGEFLTVDIQMLQNSYSPSFGAWPQDISQPQHLEDGDDLVSSRDDSPQTPYSPDLFWSNYQNSDCEPARPTDLTMNIQPQVPAMSTASCSDLSGQMSWHTSSLADSNLPPGYDPRMTSLDPRKLMSTDWAAKSGQL